MASVVKSFTINDSGSLDILSGTIEIEDDMSFDYKKYCS